MDDAEAHAATPTTPDMEAQANIDDLMQEIKQVRNSFESRLILAHLRTEAVRAGMIDLDGLKLADLSKAQLGPEDKVVGGRELIEDMRRQKPWLFTTSSSSSTAAAPASQPVRNKSAMEMTDQEYSAAKAALTKRRY